MGWDGMVTTTTTTTIAAMMNDGGSNRNTTQKNATAAATTTTTTSSSSSKKRRRMLLFVMVFAVTFLQLLLITATTTTTTTKTTKEYTVYNTNPIICSYRPFESFNPVGYIKEATIATKKSSSSSSSHHHHHKKFAYAFVVAGCTSSSLTSSSSSCQAYILNAIVASTVLKNYNSTSDILFCVRMASSSSSSSDDRLSCEEEQMLQMAGIQLYYLPKIIIIRRRRKGGKGGNNNISKSGNNGEEEKEEVENFGTITLEKFRVLEMTKYERVYFLDADLIPLCNIDYHMELSYNNNNRRGSSSSISSSDSAVLQQYVGMQGSREPINTGSFIVTPKDGLFDNVLNIVHRHREKDIEPQVFNPINGWGHTIMNDDNDRWYASEVNGLLWNFHGFQVDQGIMYYWLKYEIRNWSHILENGEIDTWRDISSWTDEDKVINKVNAIKVTNNQYIALVNKSKAYQINNNNNNNNNNTGCRGHLHGRNKGTIKGLALDMYHYKGKEKPWLEPIIADSIPTTYSTNLKGRDVWLYWLGVANTTLGIKLPDRIDISSSSSSSSSGGDGRGPTVLDWKSDRNMLLQPGIELPRPTPRGG